MARRFRVFFTGRAALVRSLPVALAAALFAQFTVTAARAEYAENFDGVVAPALPGSWTTAQFGFTWITTTDTPDTAPNCAAATPLVRVSEAYLDSPLINVGNTIHLVRFRHRFVLESAPAGDGVPAIGYDGGVLEIAIGPADFQDIVTAGGVFVTGGYTLPISNQTGSLIAGRQAWSGDSGGYIATIIRLPASTLNSTIRLRFRLSCDNSVGGGIWAIDTLDAVDDCVSQDTAPPTVVCPPSIFRLTPSDPCSDPRIILGDVTGLATATDNCPNPLVLTQDPPAATRIGPGTSTVTIIATDAAGNVGQCTTTLTVVNPVAGQCGICCGAGMVETLLVMFISHAGIKLSRRRSLRRTTTNAPRAPDNDGRRAAE